MVNLQSNKTHSINSLKIIILTTKPPTPYHIGDIVKNPLRGEWYDSILSNYEKMGKSTTLNAPFERSLLPPVTKIIRPIILFKVKKIDIDNQYDLYSITYVDV